MISLDYMQYLSTNVKKDILCLKGSNKNTFLETFTTGPYLTFFWCFILLTSLM
jgi:hypothetical protein